MRYFRLARLTDPVGSLFTLQALFEQTDFSDAEVDTIASLEVGQSLVLDNDFEVRRIT